MTWKRYLVEFSETRQDENGHTVPVLPWDGTDTPAQWVANPDGRGGYGRGYVMASVFARDHSVFEKFPNMTPLPDLVEGREVKDIPAKERQALQSKIQTLGVPVQVGDRARLQDVLTALGRELKPSFDISRLKAG